ncbi:TPA: fimbrial protein [Klebsiella oxytoca]|nr:fimbrial protein [Klebsiella oxytoca]
MRKLFYLMMTALVLTVFPIISSHAQAQPQTRGITGDTCRNSGILFTNVSEADKSLNLSSAFINSNVVEYTYTTSWAGSMTCTYGNIGVGGLAQDHLYYFTAFNNSPVYLHFNSANGENSYWIKLTSAITGSTKVTVSGIVGIHSLGYQTQYTLRAELLTVAPTGVESITKTTTNGALTIISAVMSGSGSGSDGWSLFDRRNYAQRAWDNMMAETPRKSWSTSDFLAYEKLTIQFEPKETTCNMLRDMSIHLPPAPYNVLKKKGRAEGSDFTIPLRCGNLAGIKTSTRNVQIWLSSNDLVETDVTKQIMVNSETTAGGVGVAIRSRIYWGDYEEVQISSSNDLEHATPIKNIDKGDDISSIVNIDLHAYYKVYDSSKLSTGTVVATAQIMFSYD